MFSEIFSARVAAFLLFPLYVLVSCGGLYLIKAAQGWRTPGFFVGFGLYSIGALIWMFILRLTPLSVAFPVASGSLLIGTMVTGSILLGESVTIWQLAGGAFILIGIVLIAGNR